MARVDRFEDLRCWQTARVLVKEVYEVSSNGRAASDYGFRDQIRRASISVLSNIAEGFGRKSSKEFIRYLEISFTSANELKSLLYVALDLAYFDESTVVGLQQKIEETKSMNLALIRYLRAKSNGSAKSP